MKTRFFVMMFFWVLVECLIAAEILVWDAGNQFEGWKARRNVRCETTPEFFAGC